MQSQSPSNGSLTSTQRRQQTKLVYGLVAIPIKWVSYLNTYPCNYHKAHDLQVRFGTSHVLTAKTTGHISFHLG